MRAENARLGVETNEGGPRSAIGIKAPIKSHRSISGARPALSEPAWKRPAGPRMGSSSQAGDSQLNRSNFWEAPKDATFQSAHGRGAGAAHISSVVARVMLGAHYLWTRAAGEPNRVRRDTPRGTKSRVQIFCSRSFGCDGP